MKEQTLLLFQVYGWMDAYFEVSKTEMPAANAILDLRIDFNLI